MVLFVPCLFFKEKYMNYQRKRRNNFFANNTKKVATTRRANSEGGGNFFGNFSDVLGSVGGLFANVSTGISHIWGAKNTTTTIVSDPNQNTKNTGLWLGIGIVAVVLVLILAFAFNKR
jgi:hypothetical protein